jgi:hypothetical protein
MGFVRHEPQTCGGQAGRATAAAGMAAVADLVLIALAAG